MNNKRHNHRMASAMDYEQERTANTGLSTGNQTKCQPQN